MADRDVRITIEVKTGRARKEVQGLEKDTSGLNSTAVAAGASVKKSFGKILRSAAGLVSTALIVNQLRVAVQQSVATAVRYESALTQVAKTTGLTRGEVKALGRDLTDLSVRLGVSQFDLAEIAATAGQLGIQGSRDILAFTETVAKLSNVTELSAEQASEQIARIANSFNLPISQAEKLGSVLNELSNTTTAKAGDISDSLARIGTAGSSIGITVDQAAALSSVLIDAGIESRRAGTSLRNTFIRLQTEAEKLGEIAGVTGAEFNAMVEEDALAALRTYLDGLQQLPPALAAVKIKEVFGDENFLAVQTLSAQTELLNKNLATSLQAFDEGTSLGREFAVTMDTVGKQWEILRANIEAFATAAGDEALPMLFDLLSGVNDLLGGVDRLADGILRLRDQMGATDEAERLLEKYEELAGKTSLTQQESEQLRKVTDELASRFPNMIRGYNDLGEATGVYADSIQRAVEQQRALLRLQEEDRLEDMGDEFEFAVAQLEKLRSLQGRLEQRGRGEAIPFIGTVGSHLDDVRVAASKTKMELAKLFREASRLFDPATVSAQQLTDELRIPISVAERVVEGLRTIARSRDEALGGGEGGGEGNGEGGGSGDRTGELAKQRELQALKIQLMEEGLQKELAHIEFEYEEKKRLIREKFPEQADEIIALLDAHRERLREAAFGLEDMVQIDGQDDLGVLEEIIDEFHDRAMTAEEELTQKILEGAQKRVEARETEIEAEKRLQEERDRAVMGAAQAAAMRASSVQDVLNSIRQEIKAELALAVAKQLRKVLATVPFPFNLAAAAAAGGAVGLLFEKVIPSFRSGVTDFEGGIARVHEGEMLVNMPSGSNVVTNENTDRLIAAMDRMPSAGGSSFSDDRMVRQLQSIEQAIDFQTERLESVERRISVQETHENLGRLDKKRSRL